jgi:hypothetical protein
MRRTLTLIVPALLLAALFSSYMGITKISASTADPLVHHVTCSGNGCNGLDPIATGCASDAIIVTVTGGTTTFSTGTIQLRYSPTCGTNWGRVISSVGNAQLTVSIRRNDGLFYFTVGNGTRLWSPMVFARTTKAKACGSAGHFEDCTEAI